MDDSIESEDAVLNSPMDFKKSRSQKNMNASNNIKTSTSTFDIGR